MHRVCGEVCNDSVERFAPPAPACMCIHLRAHDRVRLSMGILWEYFGISSNEQKFTYFYGMSYETLEGIDACYLKKSGWRWRREKLL